MRDYIDRQAVKDWLLRWEGYIDKDTITRMQYRVIDIPSAEVEPAKHGRWKPFDLTWGRSVYACTSCGEAFEVPTEMGKPIFIYCPNCGAKMEAAPTIIEAEEGTEI